MIKILEQYLWRSSVLESNFRKFLLVYLSRILATYSRSPSLNTFLEHLHYSWGVIFITTLSLFHFFRNSQHPEKWSVSFTIFFKKCEYIRGCYLPISSNLLKKSFRETSTFLLTVTGVLENSVLLAAYFKLLL